MALSDFPDTIDLAFDETDLPDDGRHEPLFVATPCVVDLQEARRLDPTRIDLGPDPPPAKRSFWRGPIGSLLLHLLPLLILIGWPGTPLDIPTPIPVQLVIEQPPPPPPPTPPQPEKSAPTPKLQPGLRASDDFGSTKVAKGTEPAPPTSGEPPPPAPMEQQTTGLEAPSAEAQVAAAPPPLPPKPTPPKPQAAVRLPKPEGLQLPLPVNPDQPPASSHSARLPGPDATRDEYCAYALKLTMSHINLLPLSLLGARHGDTSVSIRVLRDGTISGVKVARGSGYMDIDERIQEMVMAVGRFPPLPEWISGTSIDFTFHLHFPHPAEQ
jgi:periplasmic protein TonB